MEAKEIEGLLKAHIDDCQAQVTVDGGHVNLVVVSPAFAGLTPLKKQQMVYGALNHLIADGTIHAVHMQTHTPDDVGQ